MTTADKYSEHRLDNFTTNIPTDWGISGVFFNGSAYVFGESSEETLRALKVSLLNGAPTFQSTDLKVRFFRNPTACVHRGTIFLLCASIDISFVGPAQDGMLQFAVTDGTQCSQVKDTGVRMWSGQLGAASIGERLYVFGPSYEGAKYVLKIAWTDDMGATWHEELKPDDWINLRDIVATTFTDRDGRTTVMFGAVTIYNNVWTTRYLYDPNGSGSRLQRSFEVEEHVELRGKGNSIALATGSVEGGAAGPAVQLFINGSHGNIWAEPWSNNSKREWLVERQSWGPIEERTHGDTRYPSWQGITAVQFLRPLPNDGVQQELWCIQNYEPTSFTPRLMVARWQSDRLEYKSEEFLDAPDELRVLVGVVEGAPPYVLNGSAFKDTVSGFTFSWASTEVSSVTTQFKFGAFVKVSSKKALPFDLGTVTLSGSLKIAADLAYRCQTAETRTISVDRTIAPEPTRNETLYIYLRPTIRRALYVLSDASGNELASVYAYTATRAHLDFETENNLSTFYGSPNTNDARTWLYRYPRLPDFADDTPGNSLDEAVTWERGGSTAFTFSRESARTVTLSSSVSIEVTTGLSFFEMGGNSSFSYEAQISSKLSEKVSFKLAYPNPRDGHPEDIARVVLRVMMFAPREGQIERCYWIPADRRSQRPWCIAWSIDELRTAGELERTSEGGPGNAVGA